MPNAEQILLRTGSGVIGARPTTTVLQAAQMMLEANVACLIVEQHPDILGVFTERDALRRVLAAGKDPAATHLAEVMTSPVITCEPREDLESCLKKMADNHIRHLVVIDRGELLGVLSLRDLLAAR